MISSSRGGADYTPKQEDNTREGKISKAAASSSSRSWSRSDPRIVRVSSAFGGKDRHSKVCTVRGLRDRRVRLSIPTAIQLYDLQDKLGLNQPSKVIDWLLNAAKHEIDELPPLQMPRGNFSQIHHPMPSTNSRGLIGHHDSQSAEKSQRQLNIYNWNDPSELSTSNYWSTNSDGNFRDHMNSKEIVEEREANDKENWKKRKQGDFEHQGHDHAYISSNNFFARANHSNSLTGLLNNVMPVLNSSFLRRDPSNLSLSHTEDHPHQNFNFVPILPSNSLSMPSGSHQFVVYPPADGEFDPKQMINFQMLSSGTSTSQNSPLSNSSFTPPLNYTIGQAMRPFHLSMNPYGGSAPTKDH